VPSSADWVPAAARNNAEWCDLVCRTHGLVGSFDALAWSSPVRTPLGYPDAVTLTSEVDPLQLLARIDTGGGCSVKDSFACLDLAPHGFRVLFDAQWIVRPSAVARSAGQPTAWALAYDAADFERWVEAWAENGGMRDVLLPQLLDDDRIRVVSQLVDERIVGGAVLNLGSDPDEPAIGLSNVFTEARDVTAWWDSCLGLVNLLYAGRSIVGYERDDALDAALANGFAPAGPLRVWIRDLDR
jgi:hypothetical protein